MSSIIQNVPRPTPSIPAVVKTECRDAPLYLQALLPSQQESTDAPGAKNDTDPTTEGGNGASSSVKTEGEVDAETSLSDLDKTLDCSIDSYENPFLKAPKKAKSKP